jgi:hypothetical protein
MTGTNRTVLLVSNRRLEENAGRAEKFKTRAELLEEFGWNVELAHVEPTLHGTFRGIKKCLSQVQEADVINSVSNPPHLQVVGLVVAKLTQTPWLAEFRDPLVQNPDVDPESLAGRGRRVLEGLILRHADHVIWYDGIQIPEDYFQNTYPAIPETRYEMLPPIGFEQAIFESTDARSFESFTVTYAGSFYEGWIEPYTFLDGFSAYVNERPSPDVQAFFFGDWDPEYDRAVDRRNLESFVDRCWANVATSNATLAVHVEGTIRADESRLGQLFENLFRNSVEHGSTTPRSDARGDSVEHGSTNNRRAERAGDSVEHGSTDSRPEADDSVEHGSTDATPARDAGVTVTVGTLPDGFYVADDGSGIPESERDRILEAGYSTDPNGTGLGLAIVRDVVEAHGWQLSIGESESGGARFDVTGVQALSNSSP